MRDLLPAPRNVFALAYADKARQCKPYSGLLAPNHKRCYPMLQALWAAAKPRIKGVLLNVSVLNALLLEQRRLDCDAYRIFRRSPAT